MKATKKTYDDSVIIGGVTRATEKTVKSYYDVDLDSLYKLNDAKKKKSSHRREENKADVNSYIEEQLALGLPEETVRHRVNSYLRTLNHNRIEIRNEEEREIYERLEKRLAFEEKAIDIETLATFLRNLPGATPYGVTPESRKTASEVYAMTILRADPKEREKFYAKLDDLLFKRMMTINDAIIFRKCLDIEISNMINNRVSRDQIESTIKQRIEDFKTSGKMPYSIETITKAKVLAKIDNLETGVETYVDEEDYVPVKERLKILRASVKANRNARRVEESIQNKK